MTIQEILSNLNTTCRSALKNSTGLSTAHLGHKLTWLLNFPRVLLYYIKSQNSWPIIFEIQTRYLRPGSKCINHYATGTTTFPRTHTVNITVSFAVHNSVFLSFSKLQCHFLSQWQPLRFQSLIVILLIVIRIIFQFGKIIWYIWKNWQLHTWNSGNRIWANKKHLRCIRRSTGAVRLVKSVQENTFKSYKLLYRGRADKNKCSDIQLRMVEASWT